MSLIKLTSTELLNLLLFLLKQQIFNYYSMNCKSSVILNDAFNCLSCLTGSTFGRKFENWRALGMFETGLFWKDQPVDLSETWKRMKTMYLTLEITRKTLNQNKRARQGLVLTNQNLKTCFNAYLFSGMEKLRIKLQF